VCEPEEAGENSERGQWLHQREICLVTKRVLEIDWDVRNVWNKNQNIVLLGSRK